jgi:aminomuconate-semialdehyde/2-hydroxymuconate-6-semialdehyde dehydrogenase
MLRLDHWIDGSPVRPSSGEYLDVHEPATGVRYAQVAAGDACDVEAAVHAAERAFPAWSATSVSERGRLLERLADLIDAHLDELAAAESMDSGKPVSLAREVDIPRSASNLRYFAHAVQHAGGEFFDFDGGGVPGGARAMNMVLRSPRGVAGCISPWNLPLYLLTWKISPALATGNTVVAKPSEVTPRTASMLAELSAQAGLPPGVLNIVHGDSRAGRAIVTHERVPTITFTGSTAVGRWIGSQAGGMLKRVSLELGGKNPFIIMDDADVDAAIKVAARAAFRNQGQICLCGSRLLVHERVLDRVRAGIVEAARSLAVGDPSLAATQFGSLVSEPHRAKVSRMVDVARSLGGSVLTGGGPVDPARLPERCRAGAFYQPTVVEGLDASCEFEQEEVFGPVVSLRSFRSDEEALQLANGTKYGLAATIFTRDLARTQRFSRSLAAGIVWVNCWMVRDLRTPFGGVRQSGVGREGGSEALRFFTEPKNVCIAG